MANDIEDWLKEGYDKGWVGPPVCSGCDGIPVYEDEVEADACIYVLRVYEDEQDKTLVEDAHPPSVWRATNQGWVKAADGPRTVAEQLDAARDGQEFSNVIQGVFRTLEQKMAEEDQSS